MANDEPHYMSAIRDPERYKRDFLASRDLPGAHTGERPPWTIGKSVIVILCVLPVVGYIMVGVWFEAMRDDARRECAAQYSAGSPELATCLRWADESPYPE